MTNSWSKTVVHGMANKEIVLGITGSIAAYKACDLASRLVEAGAKVIPALTRSAQKFVGAASLEGITGNPAILDLFEAEHTREIQHIAVAKRADLFLIAPATANIMAKAAHGRADDWLSTALLATRAPVLFAPAMNVRMYTHPATQANIATLIERGCHFTGLGRLAGTTDILDAAAPLLSSKRDLAGKRVLITSGANHEPIDPVRYIANRSSGKMGCAIAREALRRGAEVTIISGPSETTPPRAARVFQVATAQEMLEAVTAHFEEADIFIAAAAVADYRVDAPKRQKQKRDDDSFNITLHPNPDIAAHIGFSKAPGQLCIGFAAETDDLQQNAKLKLEKKNLDLIVANEVGVPGSGFGAETTRACLITPDGASAPTELISKVQLAEKIFDKIATLHPSGQPAPGASRPRVKAKRPV